MANQPADQDIIQAAYADRLKALFDNYADVAPSDPDGAKAKFATGVAFLRQLRDSAVQVVAQAAVPDAVSTPHARPSTVATKARKKR